MEIIVFIGIPASGKSTFYRQNFFTTHMRINLDMLRTRKREDIFIEACLKARQPFVIDNTNTTEGERKKYVDIAKQAGIPVIGYYFETTLQDAIKRNQGRTGKGRIPTAAIAAANKRLVAPTYEEGFDMLYIVKVADNGAFLVDMQGREGNNI
jgi:predicted kinase